MSFVRINRNVLTEDEDEDDDNDSCVKVLQLQKLAHFTKPHIPTYKVKSDKVNN